MRQKTFFGIKTKSDAFQILKHSLGEMAGQEQLSHQMFLQVARDNLYQTNVLMHFLDGRHDHEVMGKTGGTPGLPGLAKGKTSSFSSYSSSK